MAPTPIQIKRTSVTGRTPNTTASYSTNSAYISTGELSINFTDKKMFSSDGSLPFEIGANLVNQNVTGFLSQSLVTVAANGITQGTAKPLTTYLSIVITSGATASGVILPNVIGAELRVTNKSTLTVTVYPPVSSQIDSAGVNTGRTLVANASGTFFAVSNTQMYQVQ